MSTSRVPQHPMIKRIALLGLLLVAGAPRVSQARELRIKIGGGTAALVLPRAPGARQGQGASRRRPSRRVVAPAVARELALAWTSPSPEKGVHHALRALRQHDRGSYQHTKRVALYAYELARAHGLPLPRVRQIVRAALLHDVGKLGVSPELINSRARLSPQQRARLQQHAAFTGELAPPAARATTRPATMHHEKLDRSGYPHRLGRTELPLAARILTVADMADALAAHRPYRGALTTDQVLRILRSSTPHALDSGVVQQLGRLLDNPSRAMQRALRNGRQSPNR